MTFYEVRIFANNQWNTIRTYGNESEATNFAQSALTDSTWDIKATPYDLYWSQR